jgi:hypothetical protein
VLHAASTVALITEAAGTTETLVNFYEAIHKATSQKTAICILTAVT